MSTLEEQIDDLLNEPEWIQSTADLNRVTVAEFRNTLMWLRNASPEFQKKAIEMMTQHAARQLN